MSLGDIVVAATSSDESLAEASPTRGAGLDCAAAAVVAAVEAAEDEEDEEAESELAASRSPMDLDTKSCVTPRLCTDGCVAICCRKERCFWQ